MVSIQIVHVLKVVCLKSWQNLHMNKTIKYMWLCRACKISLHSHHVSLDQWTTGTHLLPVMRDLGSNPLGVFMWNWDSPVSVVLLHWWPRRDWSLWPCLRRASSQTVSRPSCQQRDNPTWSHTAFLSQFHVTAGLLSGFTTDGVGCWGGALWRACNLTLFSPCLTGPVDYLFASRHDGPGFKSPGGTYVKPGFSC